jgi:hypothetical protein
LPDVPQRYWVKLPQAVISQNNLLVIVASPRVG